MKVSTLKITDDITFKPESASGHPDQASKLSKEPSSSTLVAELKEPEPDYRVMVRKP